MFENPSRIQKEKTTIILSNTSNSSDAEESLSNSVINSRSSQEFNNADSLSNFEQNMFKNGIIADNEEIDSSPKKYLKTGSKKRSNSVQKS
jgi:hypothetical protein